MEPRPCQFRPEMELDLEAIDCPATSQELISRFVEIEAEAVKLEAFSIDFCHYSSEDDFTLPPNFLLRCS
jgi:hypothetical protein